MAILNIFDYSSYRKYLSDYCSIKKQKDHKYSLIFFSRLIQASDAYLKQVISSRRSLNIDKARKLTNIFKLTSLETSYFLTLVMKENAKTNELKNYFEGTLEKFKELSALKYNDDIKLKNVFNDSLSWEIYTLIGTDNFKNDPRWITSALTRNDIKPSKVKLTIQHLVKIGVVEIKNGKLKTKDVILKDVHSIKDIYMLSLQRALKYLKEEKQTQANDYFDSFCMILSEEEFQKIKKLLEETKMRMATIVENSSKKDKICYYNTNLFYASKNA